MRDCRKGYLQNLFISTATCLMRPIEGLKQSHFHNNERSEATCEGGGEAKLVL